MPKVVERFRSAIAALGKPGRSKTAAGPADSAAAPSALAVVKEGTCRSELETIFHDAGWRLIVEHSIESALQLQRREPTPVVLYDRDLPDGCWREAVVSFSRLSPRPCLVLLAQRPDKNLWDEVVRCGGFDVLRMPVERDTVIRTVSAAWTIWRHQYQRS